MPHTYTPSVRVARARATAFNKAGRPELRHMLGTSVALLNLTKQQVEALAQHVLHSGRSSTRPTSFSTSLGELPYAMRVLGDVRFLVSWHGGTLELRRVTR